MAEFQVILEEGLFYEQEDILFVEHDGGTRSALPVVLAPLVGRRVQFALHHLPPDGLQPERPGAGSCRFPEGRGCPVRHDQHPDRLLAFHLDGVLKKDPWRLEKFDGTEVVIPFGGMPGHYGRVAAATVLDVEAMRDALMKDPSAAAGLKVRDLEAVLARLRETMGRE